jgi:hypothetical protein
MINESWASSFLVTFKYSNEKPDIVLKGDKHQKEFERLVEIAKMNYPQIAKDKHIEWIPVEQDAQIEFTAKTITKDFLITTDGL